MNPAIKKALFLGYDAKQTTAIQALQERNCLVEHSSEPLTTCPTYDFAISFGYRHILKKETIRSLGCPIFNLHISFLPFNRGAHPSFWSLYDNTPNGVTIHLIDEGVDTGPIIAQQRVLIPDSADTFEKAHRLLIKSLEGLFLDNVDTIISGNWSATPQQGLGSHHFINDLPTNFSGWNANIKKELSKLRKEGLRYERN
jgi:methionyl-tRNA formyltransferase